MNHLMQRDAAEDIGARTLWGEGRNQPDNGLYGIAHSIANRVEARSWYGNSVIAVCLMPAQYSCWRPSDPNLLKLIRVDETDPQFVRCLSIAREVFSGQHADNTSGSTHYLTRAAYERHQQARERTAATWSKGLTPAATLGDHLFFNNVP